MTALMEMKSVVCRGLLRQRTLKGLLNVNLNRLPHDGCCRNDACILVLSHK